MSEASHPVAWYRSIFVRQLAIMLATTVSLILFVGGFFYSILGPSLSMSRGLVAEYARALASTSPGQAKAREIADRLGLQVRYEGPGGTWETAPGLPHVSEVRKMHWHDDLTLTLAPAPQGGTYLIYWELGRRMRRAHSHLLWVLHAVMAMIVLLAYLVLRRSLRPLRALHEGVARLSEGELDVTVPSRTRDEFGALAEAFNQMVRRISEMLRARDQLLLDVSHELRSPLTRIKVALALLPEGDKQRRIEADVAEMEAMIAELLELERLRGGQGLRRERLDLVALLRQVAEGFEDRPPGVRFVAAAPEIWAEVDGEKIRVVLRNLLENAFKYSLADSRPVEVVVKTDGEAVTLVVADDGPGLPADDLHNLFEPFFRVDRSRSKKSGGYGLGLSICKRIVEAHGGRIEAANRSGRGAEFTVTLPVPPP
ncbi:MAG TPA: HAMP domain-containing sensor histidine kinase [Thermoanaerobaculia bacterium]|jgi:signal transduction histidine kinase|nr:HAMP domain-containing sensor histidine kinase [Thermoanaerobaculia bacterium]